MEADISILRKTGHFYFALTREPHAGSSRIIAPKERGRIAVGSPFIQLPTIKVPSDFAKM